MSEGWDWHVKDRMCKAESYMKEELGVRVS